MIQVRSARNPHFRTAANIAVQFTDWECLQHCYNTQQLDPITKNYLLFFLEHIYRNETFGTGRYYGYA